MTHLLSSRATYIPMHLITNQRKHHFRPWLRRGFQNLRHNSRRRKRSQRQTAHKRNEPWTPFNGFLRNVSLSHLGLGCYRQSRSSSFTPETFFTAPPSPWNNESWHGCSTFLKVVAMAPTRSIKLADRDRVVSVLWTRLDSTRSGRGSARSDIEKLCAGVLKPNQLYAPVFDIYWTIVF